MRFTGLRNGELMETFKESRYGDYIIFNSNHTLEHELGHAELIDESIQESFNLNTESLYALVNGGKRWDCVFVRWYGSYAIFSSPVTSNCHAIHYSKLRTFVKRVKQ